MAENNPDIFQQIQTLFNSMSFGKKLSLFVLVSATVLGFVFLMTWTGTEDFQPLFTNLSQEDAGAIVAKLKEKKIPYQVSSNGNSILIPNGNIYDIRLQLASEGLPQGGGIGFEIFDNTKLGMTEFVQNVNYQRALQGELSRTINSITEIETSRIHLVLPAKSLFLEEQKPASASITLKLRPGRRLSKSQIDGIVHLVSASVSGLNPEDVTIIDNYGTLLAGLKENDSLQKATSSQLDFKEKMEKGIETRITSMLEGILGEGNAIVRCASTMDFRQQERTEIRFRPDNKVPRSEQTLISSSSSDLKPSGVPGSIGDVMPGETPETPRTNNTNNKNGYQKEDRTVNYEIGKMTSHTVEPIGKTTKISVAVIVDGTYKLSKVEPSDAKGKNKGEGEMEMKYFPRTNEELDQLKSIVKRAMNYDEARGDEVEIINMPFESTVQLKDNQTEEPQENWLTQIKEYMPSPKHIFLSLFILFSFLYVIRPMVRWVTTVPIESMSIVEQLPKTVQEIETENSSVMALNEVVKLLKGDSSSSDIMKDWLKE